MKAKNVRALIKDFPLLYRDMRLPSSKSCAHWGFQVGDGFYGLLYELSLKIDARASALCANLPDDYPVVRQIKEKFGELRFSLGVHAVMDFSDLVKEAQARARVTCELCGKPGHMHTESWYYVRCVACEADKEAIYARRDAEYKEQEARGGFRAVIDEAFSEVDKEKG